MPVSSRMDKCELILSGWHWSRCQPEMVGARLREWTADHAGQAFALEPRAVAKMRDPCNGSTRHRRLRRTLCSTVPADRTP